MRTATTAIRLSRALVGLPIRSSNGPTGREFSRHALSKAALVSTARSNHLLPAQTWRCQGVCREGCCHVLESNSTGVLHRRHHPHHPLPRPRPRYRALTSDSRTKPEEESDGVEPDSSSVVHAVLSEPVSLQIPGSQTGGRKMAIVFTCDVCETRSAKQFTERSYLHGVVIVRCPGCQNLHLIADRLGYFDDGDGSDWDLQKIAEMRGESIRTITDGDVFEALDLEDLVGRDKMLELQNQLHSKPPPSPK